MRRILIIGSGGAGKSTLARLLGNILKIEVVHLDKEHWKPGWVEPPKDVWKQKVEELISREAWIMEGNYSGTLDLRLAACDTVILLDLPRSLCLWRVLKRRFEFRGGTRPDMTEGCPEKLNLSFMMWIWIYPRRTKPAIFRLFEKHALEKSIIHLRSREAIQKFLSEVKDNQQPEGERTV